MTLLTIRLQGPFIDVERGARNLREVLDIYSEHTESGSNDIYRKDLIINSHSSRYNRIDVYFRPEPLLQKFRRKRDERRQKRKQSDQHRRRNAGLCRRSSSPFLNRRYRLYRRQLTGGLRLVLYIKPDHTWRLSLYRPLVYPSPSEIQVVKRDFSIPATIKESQQQIDGWYIIRLEWQELTQGKLFDLQPIET